MGPSAWLGPQTNDVIKQYGKAGIKNLAIIPIAFTSDHIETLYELDKEYIEEAHKLGMTGVKRVDSLNGNEKFISSLADIVKAHLEEPADKAQQQLRLRCPGCVNQKCHSMREWAFNHKQAPHDLR